MRRLKYEPLVDEVELLHANPNYAHIRHSDGRESTVSARDLAPIGNLPDESGDRPNSSAEVQPSNDTDIEENSGESHEDALVQHSPPPR